MTASDVVDESELLKRDVIGRVRTTARQREALLDAVESGGLSGPDFARVHGIKYQTFATWRQKRRRPQTGTKPKKKPVDGEKFTLVRVESQLIGPPFLGQFER